MGKVYPDKASFSHFFPSISADENPQGRKKAATRANTVQKAIEPPARFEHLVIFLTDSQCLQCDTTSTMNILKA